MDREAGGTANSRLTPTSHPKILNACMKPELAKDGATSADETIHQNISSLVKSDSNKMTRTYTFNCRYIHTASKRKIQVKNTTPKRKMRIHLKGLAAHAIQEERAAVIVTLISS